MACGAPEVNLSPRPCAIVQAFAGASVPSQPGSLERPRGRRATRRGNHRRHHRWHFRRFLRKLNNKRKDYGEEIVRILLPLSLLAASHPLLAHDGHGLGNPLLHAFDHGMLILAGAVVLGAGILGLRALGRARRARRSMTEPGPGSRRA